MSHLKASIAKAYAEGRVKDAQAMERIEAEELRKKRMKGVKILKSKRQVK